jgi:hypothetical protein
MERRIFWIGAWLTVGGGLLVSLAANAWHGLSFAAGGALAGLNLAWLRSSVGAVVFQDPRGSKYRVLAGFLLRLLLIPLCLYAMIRFLFLGAIALIAGFALFYFSVLIEGVLQALGCKPK